MFDDRQDRAFDPVRATEDSEDEEAGESPKTSNSPLSTRRRQSSSSGWWTPERMLLAALSVLTLFLLIVVAGILTRMANMAQPRAQWHVPPSHATSLPARTSSTTTTTTTTQTIPKPVEPTSVLAKVAQSSADTCFQVPAGQRPLLIWDDSVVVLKVTNATIAHRAAMLANATLIGRLEQSYARVRNEPPPAVYPYRGVPGSQQAWLRWLGPLIAQVVIRPPPIRTTRRALFFVDNRNDEIGPLVLRHNWHMIDEEGWGLYLWLTASNYASYVQSLEIYPGGAGEHIEIRLLVDPMPDLTQVTTSPEFVSEMQVDTLLLIQTDTWLVKPVSQDPVKWFQYRTKYSWVGGKIIGLWHRQGWPVPDWAGANGAAAIRSNVMMREVTRKLACSRDGCHWQPQYPVDPRKWPEDAWYSVRIGDHAARWQGSQADAATSDGWCQREGGSTEYCTDCFWTHRIFSKGLYTHEQIVQRFVPIAVYYYDLIQANNQHQAFFG